MNNLSIILIMSPEKRCLALRYMLFLGFTSPVQKLVIGSHMKWTVLYSGMLLFAQTAQSCSRTFAPQQVETIQNEIGKTGKKSLTQLSHPSPE